MSNMDYCKFRNTLADLRDCWETFDDVSGDEELRAREKLIELCKEIGEES